MVVFYYIPDFLHSYTLHSRLTLCIINMFFKNVFGIYDIKPISLTHSLVGSCKK